MTFFVTTTAGEDETTKGNPEISKRDATDVASSLPAPEDEAASEPAPENEAGPEPTTAERRNQQRWNQQRRNQHDVIR